MTTKHSLPGRRPPRAARRAGSVWTDSGYVFTTEHGLPMDPRNVLRAVTLAANKSGLAGVNIHTLRHSATTTMLESGIHCEP